MTASAPYAAQQPGAAASMSSITYSPLACAAEIRLASTSAPIMPRLRYAPPCMTMAGSLPSAASSSVVPW